MLTDGINVVDGYIINVGVEFVITVFKGYNKKDASQIAAQVAVERLGL